MSSTIAKVGTSATACRRPGAVEAACQTQHRLQAACDSLLLHLALAAGDVLLCKQRGCNPPPPPLSCCSAAVQHVTSLLPAAPQIVLLHDAWTLAALDSAELTSHGRSQEIEREAKGVDPVEDGRKAPPQEQFGKPKSETQEQRETAEVLSSGGRFQVHTQAPLAKAMSSGQGSLCGLCIC